MTNGTIFCTCITLWICRQSLAAISFFQTESRVWCWQGFKKACQLIRQRWRRNQDRWIFSLKLVDCKTELSRKHEWFQNPGERQNGTRIRKLQETVAKQLKRSSVFALSREVEGKHVQDVNPSSSRKLVRGTQTQERNSNLEFGDMGITNTEDMTKVFQNLQDKLGGAQNLSNCAMEAYRTNMLLWRLFMSLSMKAAIHLDPSQTGNLEVYRNSKFWGYSKSFNITKNLTS